MTSRVLAVPRFGEAGGGTSAVGRLLWSVFQREWPDGAHLVALQGHGRHTPSMARKLAFGVALASRQALAATQWVLFGHLRLARVQRFVPRRRRAPHAVFLHGVEAWTPLGDADRNRVREARLRIANSAFTARRATEANPGLGPIAVCPLALPADTDMARWPHPATGNRPLVLIVGRMDAGEAYKGHDDLIAAWPHVRAAVPGAELMIVGDGDDAARLRAKALAHGDGITFAGFVDRPALDALYSRAAVFAMPSRGEGFGLVYLEAMVHGLPCIGSVHDAAGEVIEHGTTGLLVDLNDPDALGRALVSLLGDPALCRRMGQSGLDRVTRQFTFDRFSRTIVSLLDEHMSGDRP